MGVDFIKTTLKEKGKAKEAVLQKVISNIRNEFDLALGLSCSALYYGLACC